MKKSRVNAETISVIRRRGNSSADVPKTRTCTKCGNEYPLMPKYWRRSGGKFYKRCKTCMANAIKDHYRKWHLEDEEERGSTGVKCILWSTYCGRCEIKDLVGDCWRINEDDFIPETYPVKLRDNEI
jgi:hypothetical protein